MKGIEDRIEAAFEDRGLLEAEEYRSAVFETVAALDRGELRVAQKVSGEWQSNAWVMKAINLYFAVAEMQTTRGWSFRVPRQDPDKEGPWRPLAYASCHPDRALRGFRGARRRCHAWLRQHRGLRGERDDGRYVGHGRLGGPDRTRRAPRRGRRHRGVLEPPGAMPVVIEDRAFVGSRCIVVEGVRVEEELS